jgi:sigma-B regulation protein RsbU (phosphoserine phosphatase)
MLATAGSEVRSTTPPDRLRKPTWQYAVLGLLLLWAVVAQLTLSGFMIYVQATSKKFLSVPFDTAEYTTRISHVDAGYLNSGLRAGDEVVALNGHQIEGSDQIDRMQFELHPGDPLLVTVRRGSDGHVQTLNVPIRMHGYASQAPGWPIVLGLFVFFPLSCILVGFYIAFARPRDPIAWITMAMLASFSQLIEIGGYGSIWQPWREILIVYHAPLHALWPVWMLLFGLYFPTPFVFVRKRPWISWLAAAPFLIVSLIILYGDVMQGRHIRELGWLADSMRRHHPLLTILASLYIFGFFFSLGCKKRKLNDPDARRRLNIMTACCCLALTPLIPVVLKEMNILPWLPGWLITICVLMIVFFPITMGYVIVVQRAMDVSVVVRTGVRYALASTGVKILRIALVAAVAALTVHFALESGHRGHAILIAAAGVALIFGLRRLAESVSLWMDRRFFREAYNTEVILSDLSNSVAGIRDVRTLLETVTQRIADSLHVLRIAVLLERGDRLEPAYAVGFNGTAPPVELKRDAPTIRLLKQSHSPSKVYFDDPQSWVHGAPEKEQAALQTLDSQVLLPLTQNNRMLGVISLGPKRSEAPYSKEDLQLLGAVASQTGLALENARLTESIRQEVAQRERLNRELEIARDVQQRLFPQTLPKVEGLDFAGYCRPALGVGGDYYDFIRLTNDRLGIAIGDVSGKGIAAALMMASLQASLRGQTIKPSPTLSETIEHINRLVYDASAENRYATFFYGEYDSTNRVLRYVNAGHNPPIICREGDGSKIVRLDEGGVVVGLFAEAAYRKRTSRLDLETSWLPSRMALAKR